MITKTASPLKVGIVGTGYAAQKRAEAIKSDSRTELLFVTGNTPAKLAEFCQIHQATAIDSWRKLVSLPELDLIFVCTTNQGCGAIALAAIQAGKHVVVEYPLALETDLAAEIVQLASLKQKLLHVEHIEIIGGLHQALKQHLSEIGRVFFARYTTINSQENIEPSWKYHRKQFGFPLAAALSRIHRLSDLFGKVASVTCHNRYWDLPDSDDPDYFSACFCQAQLNFCSGVTAEIVYGKGNVFWQSDRTLEIYGDRGKIVFKGQTGRLTTAAGDRDLPVTPRRGLFAQDTQMVLDYLFEEQPLYIQPQASLYALEIANAAKESSLSHKIVYLD